MIVANDRDLAFLIKSNVSPATYERFRNYNFDIVELSNSRFLERAMFHFYSEFQK
jgi:hypothetical protein